MNFVLLPSVANYAPNIRAGEGGGSAVEIVFLLANLSNDKPKMSHKND